MTLVIDPRFHGPPASANGGYAAGRLAGFVDADTVEVTLRAPPPLGRELRVERTGDGAATLHDGDVLVAEARPGRLDLDVPAPVPFEEAAAAGERFPFRDDHPFPTCFVCGPQRAVGDGLRLFPGRLPDGRTATPWEVPEPMAPELVWASLDCPGGWAIPLEGRPYVLGRLAVRIVRTPTPGQRCVVMGQVTGQDGRKAYVRSSLWDPDGDLLAHARATWLAVA